MDCEPIVRAFYAALERGDSEGALALFDPNIAWLEAERSPYYSGEVRGVEAVVETVLGPIARDFEGFAAAPSDFITQADRTAAFGIYTGRFRPSGGTLHAPFVHVWTVRDGKIVGFVQHTDSAGWISAMLMVPPNS